VIPHHATPVLVTETAFQASAVLVLLGELGYLKFFLGTPFTFNQILLPQPELGALLSIARDYIISEQWTPVLAPAGAIALLALAFELLGWLSAGAWPSTREAVQRSRIRGECAYPRRWEPAFEGKCAFPRRWEAAFEGECANPQLGNPHSRASAPYPGGGMRAFEGECA